VRSEEELANLEEKRVSEGRTYAKIRAQMSKIKKGARQNLDLDEEDKNNLEGVDHIVCLAHGISG
jgi:hypothetical protein